MDTDKTGESLHPLSDIPSGYNTLTNDELLQNLSTVYSKLNKTFIIGLKLWQERLSLLSRYKQLRDAQEKQGNNIFRLFERPIINVENSLLGLNEVNKKEKVLLRAISRDMRENIDILSQVSLLSVDEGTYEAKTIIEEFNNKLGLLKKTGDRYKHLLFIHTELLDIESEFMQNPQSKSFDKYIATLSYLKAEFESLIAYDFNGFGDYFGSIQKDLNQLKTITENKTFGELIKISLISAVVRVLSTNIVGGFITGQNPLINPYFWTLTSATMPAVVILNYLDYYYGIFSKITRQINSLTNCKK